ncbi:TrbI/VirB10 family protein [Burkholderia ubonensis]|uniref:TrbI/VirB10 family protein n=2 Tax=Burkholderia cepacia complex TaxID=87882 RepID=UPI0009B47548|nr:TrbI/VirB10 family protein [Burkholderia ubonensis]
MAVADPFDSPDSVQLKGKLTGLTRVSRKVKALAAIVIVAVLGYVMFAIFGANDDGSVPSSKDDAAEAAAQQAQKSPSPASPNFGNVGSGQAVVVAQAASAASVAGMLGPTFPVGASAAGVPSVPAPASGVTAGPGGPGKVVLGPRGGPAGTDGQFQTPEQQEAARRKRELDEKRKQAIESSLDAGSGDAATGGLGAAGGTGLGATSSSSNPLLAQLAQAAGAAAAAQGAGAAGGSPLVPAIGGQQQDDQNKQGRKEQFLASAASLAKTRLNEVKMPATSPYEIKAGWIIPAALECALNSDLPGQTCARVIENVYDTATGKYLLIPQGSKLIGTYDSQIAYGQERILVVWTRLIFPDGSSISLDGMPGEDKAGNAGFDANVNNHYLKVLGSATFMALFSAGIELTQKQSTNVNGVQTNSQIISQSVGQQLGQTGAAYIQKGMNIQPTLTRGPGYKFNIVATRDIVFPGAYRPEPLTARGY